MRILVHLSLALALAFSAGGGVFAQVETPDTQALIPLENGYFLEVIPAKYVTVLGRAEEPEEQPLEWITIPAVFETVTETKIVQDAFMDIDITPAVSAEDGTVIEAAKLAMKEVPAVTREVSRRVVKTPARRVQRKMPALCNLPQSRRERVTSKIYVLYDADKSELARYENVADFMAAIE